MKLHVLDCGWTWRRSWNHSGAQSCWGSASCYAYELLLGFPVSSLNFSELGMLCMLTEVSNW